MVTKRDEDYLFAGYLIRLRPNLEKVVPKYLLHCLSSHNLRVQIESKAKSTSGVKQSNKNNQAATVIALHVGNIEPFTPRCKRGSECLLLM